jgi:hypothetical protein
MKEPEKIYKILFKDVLKQTKNRKAAGEKISFRELYRTDIKWTEVTQDYCPLGRSVMTAMNNHLAIEGISFMCFSKPHNTLKSTLRTLCALLWGSQCDKRDHKQ